MFKGFVVFIVLFGVTLFAETKMEYGVSILGMRMDYREYNKQDQLLDSEESNFNDVVGAEFIYRYFLNNNSNIDVKFLGVDGDTKYTGSYLGASDSYGSVTSSTKNKIYDIALGYNLKKASTFHSISMLGGLGVGYRYWYRELSSIQAEEYSWYSIRGNIGMEYHVNNFSASFLVEYQYGIKPIMQATGFSDDFKLDSANIIKLSVPLRYNVYKNLDLTCEYIFERQDIKESDAVYDNSGNGYVEPDSTAYNQYIKIGMLLKY